MAARSERSDRSSRSPHPLPPLLYDLAAGRNGTSASVDAHLLSMAREHRLTGLLWTWARENVADVELKSALAQHDLFVQAHLGRVWEVLEASVARLSAAGIEVATIKGVTSEARWYDRRGERPCSDVDLLLAPHQLDLVAEAVRLIEPDHPWASDVASMAATGRIQAVTTHLDGLEVDVHLDLLKVGVPTRQSIEMWELTTPYPLPGGGSVRVLDDTTALLHLLVHLNKDRFQRLLGYADVVRIMAAGRVDWARLERFAHGEGIAMSAFRTLEVVLDELSLPWPVELERPSGFRARVWNLIWRENIRLRGSEGRLRFRRRQDWIPFLARGRRLEALRWWLREMWPPGPIVAAHYAHIRGPYLWKLIRGRLGAARATRATRAGRP